MIDERKIIDLAEKLFYENSFSAVGVDLLKEKIGISKTTLYKKFGSKHGLIVAVLKSRDISFRKSLRAFAGDGKDIRTIEKIFEWHFLWFSSKKYKGCLFLRCMLENNSTKDNEIVKILADHKSWLRTFIRNRLPPSANLPEAENLIFCCIEGMINLSLYELDLKKTFNNLKSSTIAILTQ